MEVYVDEAEEHKKGAMKITNCNFKLAEHFLS